MNNSPEKPAEKKPYHPPVVEEYGDVRELTKSVGMTGMNDPGSGNASMTGL